MRIEDILKRDIEKNMRQIYGEMGTIGEEEDFQHFKYRFHPFARELATKIRELIKESRKEYDAITNEGSRKIFLDWQIQSLVTYFITCNMKQEILEYELE